MPSKEFLSRYQGGSESTRQDTRRAPGEQAQTRRVERVEIDTAGAFSLGAGDTITFGFLDEAGAFVDAIGGTAGRDNIWNSDLSFGEIYERNLKANRDILGQAEDENGGAFLTGQIAGGFVPFMGWGGRSVKGMTLAGAGYGGLYGLGSGEGGLDDRLTSAATYGATGALGGYVFGAMLIPAGKALHRTIFKKGGDVAVDAAALPARKPIELETPKAKPKGEPLDPPGLNTNVGVKAADSAIDDLEDGMVLTAKELLGEPGAAREAITKRLGKMSKEQAQRLFQRIEDAEAKGTVVADPHYRSLLQVDLSGTKLTTDEVVQVAELFEEATEQLADKAGIRGRTLKGMEQEVQNELKKGITLGELDEAYEASKKGFVKTRIAQHIMLSSTAKIIRLREEMMKDVLNGVEGSKEKLAEELTDAAHRFVLARGILSNAGRALGILSHGTKQVEVEVADDVFSIESADVIRARVDDALRELDDTQLAELLGQVRTMADSQKIAQLLMSKEDAAAFSVWHRAVNTVSLFLRSNALTPATGLFNAASLVFNDFFRNELGRGRAVRNLRTAGRVDEAKILRMEQEAGRAVYAEAHKRGMKALMKRIKWEWWTDVERIAAVGWGKGTVAAKARLNRTTMLADGFVPPELREFRERHRLNVNPQEFNAKYGQSAEGAFGQIVYQLHKARAVAANTLDAAGGAAMKLFTGAIDDWGREFVRVKETYAQATRFAVREAMEAGVPEDQMSGYVSKRAKELSELPPAQLMERVEAALIASDKLEGEGKFLAEVTKRVQDEAEKVLFLDGPQTTLGKVSANALSTIDRLGVVFPYVRTPIRLFEAGVVNYGPFGMKAAEVTKILRRGEHPNATPDEKLAAHMERARVEVGTMIFQAGLAMGLAGAFVATNGGYNNSANLDAGPPNRINLPGGGFIEFGRMDPFSYTMGMGAIIGQAFKDGFADGSEYDQEQALRTGLSTALLGSYDSILGKSYLQGLEELMDVVGAFKDPDQLPTQMGKLMSNAVARLIPAAGVNKQLNESFRSSAIESVGFVDNMLRHIPGAGYGMAPRVDPLGDEVKGRTFGLNYGSSELTEGEPTYYVKQKLRDLKIDITTIRKSDPDGFDLTSEQLSEVRKIRAKEALNDQGLTMIEALEELFDDPWFNDLPTKDQQRAEIVAVMREFNKPAWEILRERNPQFDANKTYMSSFEDYLREGQSPKEAEAWALEDVESYGLPDPQL